MSPRIPERVVWRGMKQRCYNPNSDHFQYYGGRGIAVCSRWLDSFESFYADMGARPSPKHSIERRDNDGPYDPDNCTWATVREQSLNTRRNRVIAVDGESAVVGVWAERFGVSGHVIRERLRRGWDPTRAVTTPLTPVTKATTRRHEIAPGAVFGRLTALGEGEPARRLRGGRPGGRRIRCQCACGEIRDVHVSRLTRGLTLSCGCIGREAASKRMTKHGLRKLGFAATAVVVGDLRAENARLRRITDAAARAIKVVLASGEQDEATREILTVLLAALAPADAAVCAYVPERIVAMSEEVAR
jgi:hypothetical protein